MSKYIHRVNYYETDKMGITHHSNYMRFMEEARMNFLSEIGYPMTRLEKEGITSPVVSVNCEYKHTTTYSDEIEIEVALENTPVLNCFCPIQCEIQIPAKPWRWHLLPIALSMRTADRLQ